MRTTLIISAIMIALGLIHLWMSGPQEDATSNKDTVSAAAIEAGRLEGEAMQFLQWQNEMLDEVLFPKEDQ